MAKPFKLEEAPLPKVDFTDVSTPDLRDIVDGLEDSEGEGYLCHEITNPFFEHYVNKALEGAPAMHAWGVLAWVAREARHADGDYYHKEVFLWQADLLLEAFVEAKEGLGVTAMQHYRQRWIKKMIADINAILVGRHEKVNA